MAAQQADIVFDAVGGELASTILTHLKPGADFISYGLLSGEPYRVQHCAVSPQRFHLRDTLATTQPQLWQQWFVELWPLLATSQLPEVTLFTLENWREALQAFAVAGRGSKPVLVM